MHVTYKLFNGINHSVIGGLNLVPLNDFLSTTVFKNPPRYFFDPSTNKVYSTAAGNLRHLTGTPGTSRAELGDTVFSFASRRFTLNEIIAAFAIHANKKGYPYNSAPRKSVQTPSSANGGVLTTKGNVIIGTVTNGKLSLSAIPAVHTTENSWKTEIERLAKNNPGTTFVALEVKATVVSGGLVWN